MKLGLENKKATVFLGGLLVLFAYLIYTNVFSGPPAPSGGRQTVAPTADREAPPVIAPPAAPAAAARVQAPGGRSDEFHPVLRSKHQEERINPMEVDPTLHLELLAKLQEAASENGGRNLFQFGAPPPPPQTQTAKLNLPEPVVVPQQQPVVPVVPLQPPPPPIPLKYYGLSTARANGKKTAFFLDGETILMAGEGEVLQKRYRVVRIGVNSVVLEDTQLKREQSVPLAGDPNAPG